MTMVGQKQQPDKHDAVITNNPHQKLIESLDLKLRARYPLLYIVAVEEEPVEQILAQVAHQSHPPRELLMWDIVNGWDDDGKDKNSLMGALMRISQTDANKPCIFVIRDINFVLKNPETERNAPIIRAFKNLVKELKYRRQIIIITGHTAVVPTDLSEEMTVIDFPLPDTKEIDYLIKDLVVPEKLNLTELGKEQLLKAFLGLSRTRIRLVLASALASKQEVNESDIALVLEEKKQAIRQTGILEFYSSHESLKNVGGLDKLKQWLQIKKNSFTEKARQYGIPNPKGLLLVGIQGTGKSLSAKTIANEWRLPLLRLDIGQLFGGIVGESESKTRQMIQLAEAMSPCILWIDEIDKAFGNISGGSDGDSGTSRRVFGSLITWMQEKTNPVFIVATANNVEILPAELLRKGRFDEIFFLNLPNHRERQEIFKVHLQKLRPHRLREFDLSMLADASENFSGAEIEQSIIDGMSFAFADVSQGNSRDFTTDDILRACGDTVPLAKVAMRQIEELKLWAVKTGAKTASQDLELERELETYRQQKGIRTNQYLDVDPPQS
jgi:SpoVK/Ycf46/Vps4 family AAA+-type ATPase